MTGGPASPLFIPTMAVIVLLSVYLTFGQGNVNMISVNQVEDWNALQGATSCGTSHAFFFTKCILVVKLVMETFGCLKRMH